eukprot:3195895-Prymnesium_polylepis.2
MTRAVVATGALRLPKPSGHPCGPAAPRQHRARDITSLAVTSAAVAAPLCACSGERRAHAGQFAIAGATVSAAGGIGNRVSSGLLPDLGQCQGLLG